MVHNNKVLTVSYGTFSCTLEGFEDSFGTMKDIAEYFRDLASDDRYFGAEPPQPDADMLASIAQRSLARQVEAHSTDTGGIVLRAADAAPESIADAVIVPTPEVVAAPAAEPVPAPIPEPEPVLEIIAEEIAAESAPEPTAEPTPEPTMEPEVTFTEVAETQEPEQVETPDPIAALVQDVTGDVVAEIEIEAEIEAEIEIEAEEIAFETPEIITPEPVTEPVVVPVSDAEPEPVDLVSDVVSPPQAVPAVDSIAAKLQRIRAVVSQNDTLNQAGDYIEDQHADSFVTEAIQDTVHTLNSNAEATPVNDNDSDDDSQESDDEILQVLNQLDTSDLEADEPAATPDEDIFAESAQFTETPFAEEFTEETATSDDIFSENVVPDMAPDAALFDDQFGDQTDVQDATPLRAQVVKVKRADLEAAIADGQLEQIGEAEEDDLSAALGDADDSSLSPEDEADLMRELAAVEGELSDDNIFGDDISDDNTEDTGDTDNPDQAADDAQSQDIPTGKVDLSRLMAEADEKLDDPETSSSREAYSHLRAAVASAEAERSAGGTVGNPTEDHAYRDDLADVVRPRRPAIEGERTNRRIADSRAAPLKLVAEQRIDAGNGISQRGPVRPRRVVTVPIFEAGTSNTTGADSAFAEFADRMEATELPDLLEAAAAYLSFVEGHDQFSRPQLMNKVRLIKQSDYNREDGLRSFGQLLRDGKIEKKGGGRFAASGTIGFRPDEREVG